MKTILELANKVEIDEDINKNIENMLANSEIYSYLEGKTLCDISLEIYDSLDFLSEREKYYKQLEDYRYVEKICDLRLGIYTKIYSNKWSGGILVKIDVYEKNISILLKNGQFFQRYSFNDCCVYQKISLEEKMILYSNDYYKNSESK